MTINVEKRPAPDQGFRTVQQLVTYDKQSIVLLGLDGSGQVWIGQVHLGSNMDGEITPTISWTQAREDYFEQVVERGKVTAA